MRPAQAQNPGGVGAASAPLSLVDDDTEVGTVGFRFDSTQTLDVAPLRLQIATAQPGALVRLRRRVGLGTGGAVFRFVPVEVARDAVRIQRYYARNGFPRAAVDYEARLDSSRNLASVTFAIVEGPPRLVDRVTFVGGGQQPVDGQLEAEIRDDWARFTARPPLGPGDRLDEFSLVALQTETVVWLRNRGYAFADAGVERFLDATGLLADVRIKVTAGPRARYGTVTVEGADGLAESVVLRELPFVPGDRFDARELGDGQRELFSLGLFQLALVETVDDQPRDSTVDIRVRLRRGPSRVATGFLGYFSDGGLTGRGQVTHRNLLGGAQQLSANVEARTGLGGAAGQAVSGGPIRDLRASVSLRQPYVLNRRFSLTAQPAVRSRDDEIEQSRSAELLGTLLYSRSSLRTAALGVAGRYVDLSRGQGLRLLDPDSLLNSSALTAATVVPGLDVTWGRLDNTLQPRRGIVARGAVSGAFGDIGYGRARLTLSSVVPVSERVGLALRATGGVLAPTAGTSLDAGRDYVLLRDQLYYAGGTADVRGWGTNRLGPKALVITADTTGFAQTGQATLRGDGDVNYVGIGGQGKLSASAQLNLPLPLGPQWVASVFVASGRVFRASAVPTKLLLRSTGNVADAQLADILDREGGTRLGAGAGLQYLTPVGFVSLAVGVKLNPSYLDLRNAAAVYCGDDGVGEAGACLGGYVAARKENRTFDETAISPRVVFNRIQLHLSIGQTF